MYIWAIALTTALGLAGCTSSKTPETPVELQVRSSARFPNACSRPEDVLKIVTDFLRAFNEGDAEQLKGYFGSGFQWYSVTTGPQDHVAIYDMGDLPSYFAARHQQAEKLTLTKLEVNAGSWHRGVDIVFNVSRTANDLSPETIDTGGKGMITCETKTISVWSMGTVLSSD